MTDEAHVLSLDEQALLDLRNDYAEDLELAEYAGEEEDVLLEALNQAFVLGQLSEARSLQEQSIESDRQDVSFPVVPVMFILLVCGAQRLTDADLLAAFVLLTGVCALLVKRYF